MPIMSWDTSFSVGIHEVDDDHREILDCMNAIYDASEAEAGAAKLHALGKALVAVCRRHFTDEEALMARLGYKDLKTHQMIHAKLLEKLDGHVAEIGRDGVAPKAFFDFLRYWLTSHIKGIDTRYAVLATTDGRKRA